MQLGLRTCQTWREVLLGVSSWKGQAFRLGHRNERDGEMALGGEEGSMSPGPDYERVMLFRTMLQRLSDKTHARVSFPSSLIPIGKELRNSGKDQNSLS